MKTLAIIYQATHLSQYTICRSTQEIYEAEIEKPQNCLYAAPQKGFVGKDLAKKLARKTGYP